MEFLIDFENVPGYPESFNLLFFFCNLTCLNIFYFLTKLN